MTDNKKVTIEYNGIVIDIRTDKNGNTALFIELDDHTYYIDNSTNEQIMEKWFTGDFDDDLPD
jgi:hypothetical protein